MVMEPEERIADPALLPDRRTVLRGLLGLPLLGSALGSGALASDEPETESPRRSAGPRSHVVVVGAGAFGGWTALALGRAGYRVTLLDAWGPGSSRASSGGDTRVIRGMYGPDEVYTRWVARAFRIWKESAAAWARDLYHPTGALWMFQGDDGYARSSLPYLRSAGFEVEEPSLEEARRRWPQVSFDGVRSVYFEREAGYLTARDACRCVAAAVTAEGGDVRPARVLPPGERGRGLASVRTADGEAIAGDVFVFACGPWLGELFPEAVGGGITPTRQEVFFFGTPGGPGPWDEGAMPVWIDFGERIFYGVPGNLHRGFKVADDTHGEVVDPTSQERTPSADWLTRARAQIARRFPGLAAAPLLESRVCQYENSPDGHYVIDRHPRLENVWIAGGGSGHGFKLGPAVGEHVAALVAGDAEPYPRFGLARLAEVENDGTKSQLMAGEGG
jgi:glycine/D-amino acid oxidase-like deaminating enzyme